MLLLVPVVSISAEPSAAPVKPLLIQPDYQLKKVVSPDSLSSASMNGITHAADKGSDNSGEVSTPLVSQSETKPEQKPNSRAKLITDAAMQAGVQSCADRVYQVTNFLTANSRSGAILFEPPADPDKRLVSISLGLAMKGGQIAYASESFAPNQANGCGGMYETVVYWEAGCGDVAKDRFSVFEKHGVLVNSIVVLDGGPNVKVFLVPAGTGCMAIKKELLN